MTALSAGMYGYDDDSVSVTDMRTTLNWCQLYLFTNKDIRFLN